MLFFHKELTTLVNQNVYLNNGLDSECNCELIINDVNEPYQESTSTPSGACELQTIDAGIQMSAWHGSAIPVDILCANVITWRSASPALC